MANVLIVDDSAIVRKISRRILESLHHATAEAEDAGAALKLCDQMMPDAILLDAGMPDVDGFEFLRRLRKMPNGHAPKVLFCLVEQDAAQIARAMHLGADDCLMKPFDRALLVGKVEQLGLSAVA